MPSDRGVLDPAARGLFQLLLMLQECLLCSVEETCEHRGAAETGRLLRQEELHSESKKPPSPSPPG